MTPGAEYFVAPDGDDRHPGTRQRPFATLERARQAVRARRAAGLPAGGVAVTLRGGVHARTATLQLGAADSGMAGRPVVWRAQPGETPRLSGGRRITGWSAVTATDPNRGRIQARVPIFTARLPLPSCGGIDSALVADYWQVGGAGVPFRGGTFATGASAPRRAPAIAELFYDGRPMQLGRWPDADPEDPAAGWVRASGGGTSITSDVDLPGRNWAAAAALPPVNRPWAHVNPNGWTDDLLVVTGVSGRRLTLAAAMRYPLEARQGAWHAENLLEEVDAPGEYWIDRVAGVVYFRPPDDVNPDARGGEAVVSALAGPLVSIDDGASHIRLEGLTFEATQGDLVHLGGRDHVVRGCTFRNAAGNALVVSGEGHLLAGSSFHGTGGAAIVTVGSVVKGRSPSRHCTIAGNDIHHLGRFVGAGVPGIVLSGPGGHVVQHNEIHHLPWSAILLATRSSVIERNEFHHTQRAGSDSGTIYTFQNRDAGVEIRNNHFHDVPRPGPPWSAGSHVIGVYLDTNGGPELTTGFVVEGNVFHRLGDGTLALSRGSRGTGVLDKGAGNVITGNLFARVDVPYLATFGGRGTVLANQGWITGTPLPAEGNAPEADPGFRDEARGDLANQPDGSLALTGGGRPIPFSGIGRGR